jgi:hypothetical protein
MTQMLHLSRPIPRGWMALAHVLAGAPARRRREFAQTEPSIFRSECFAEDLPPVPRVRLESRSQRPLRPARGGAGLAALLLAAPVAVALMGVALAMLERIA